MHPNALVELATELLHQVLRFEHPADSVVSDFFRRERQLGPRERHALAETIYAVLRRRPLLQHLAQSGKGEMERRLVLLAWQGNAGVLRAALAPAEVQWLEQVQAVDTAALPERLQLVVQLYFVEELNLAEIAQVLSVSIPRVHQLKAKAIEHLRKELDGIAEVI